MEKSSNLVASKVPHVLLIDHSSQLGGAEWSLETLAVTMPCNRCHYTVALPGIGPLVQRLQSRGLPIEFVPLESWRWWVRTHLRWLKFFLKLPWQFFSLVRWVRFLRRLQPDVIHFNINRLIEPVVAAHLLRIPSVMHFRDIPSSISYRFVVGLEAFYRIMNMAGYWIANSDATRKDIEPYANCPLRTIPNSLDPTKFDTLASDQQDHNFDAGPFEVAMIASLVRWKNHADFLKLAKCLCQQRNRVQFLIAGSGDAVYEAELRKMAGDFGLSERVAFLGQVDNVPALLQEVEVLVHTTDREPFGRVFIEAMAAKKPVVAYNSGGASEIVVNGETGILVPVGDIDAMAAAVSRLLDDPGLRRQMGQAGGKRVEKLYSIEQHCKAVAEVYDELLNGKSRGISARSNPSWVQNSELIKTH